MNERLKIGGWWEEGDWEGKERRSRIGREDELE